MYPTRTNAPAPTNKSVCLRLSLLATLALASGCAGGGRAGVAAVQPQVQPGTTIAVSDALGARVFTSSPKSVAARRAAAAQAYAAAPN